MLKRLFLLAPIAFALLHAPLVRADSLTETLDKACGKAVSVLGCADLATAYPEALGAVVAAVGVAHSQFNSADDCNAKLSAGSGILEKAKSYIDGVPGLPFDKLRQCSCNIVYSSPSCTSAVSDLANKVAGAISDFFSAVGLGSTTQPPDDHEKDKSDYYKANFAPYLDKMLYVDEGAIYSTMRSVIQACNDDWYNVIWVSDTAFEICSPMYRQFTGQLTARQKIIADEAAKQQQAAADALQKKKDALQQQKDSATDNARKIAMSWAQIKLATYGKQCADAACRNDVGVLAFFYYGMIATGMQDLNSSNTAVLSASNAKFDPLFKQKVAESSQRKLVVVASGLSQAQALIAPKLAGILHFDTAYAAARAKLLALGMKDPDKVLKNARLSRISTLSRVSGLKVMPLQKSQ